MLKYAKIRVNLQSAANTLHLLYGDKHMAGKPRIELDFNKVYQSNSSGPFKIIENLGRDKRADCM